MKVKHVVLALPAVYLGLSLDRLSSERFKPLLSLVDGMNQAAPMLPAVNEGRFGRAGDPLNLIFVGTPRGVRAALTEAGWTEVPTSVRGALASGLLPMSGYRLIGRRQNMNWAIAARPFSERHRFRLWRTGMADRDAREVWWGSANDDPDMDRERDLVVRTLAGSRFVQTTALLRLPQIPTEGVDDGGRAYRTDGRAAVIALKRSAPPGRSER